MVDPNQPWHACPGLHIGAGAVCLIPAGCLFCAACAAYLTPFYLAEVSRYYRYGQDIAGTGVMPSPRFVEAMRMTLAFLAEAPTRLRRQKWQAPV